MHMLTGMFIGNIIIITTDTFFSIADMIIPSGHYILVTKLIKKK